MMTLYYHVKSNRYVRDWTPFTLDEIQYPDNWLSLASDSDKAAIGLVEVKVIGQRGDDRYYWVEEQLDGPTLTYKAAPKALDGLKKSAVDQVNATVYSLLQPNDYIDTRNLRDPAYKPEWITWRDAVRTAAQAAVAAIGAAEDVDALIAATQIEWPHDPDYVATEAAVAA